MSHSLDTPTGSGDPSATDVAKDEARSVGQTTAEAGKQVAGTAADQAKEVAGEARRQASDLLSQGREHATEQARGGQQKAAGSLSALAEELRTLTDGEGASGPATDLLRQATGRVESFADHLRDREPADLLEDVRRFARRRPGAFLLGAAVAGVLAGRLTGGVVAAHKDDGPRAGTGTATPATPVDVTTGTGPLPGAPGAAAGYAAVPPVADGPGYDPVTGYSPVPPAPPIPPAPPVPRLPTAPGAVVRREHPYGAGTPGVGPDHLTADGHPDVEGTSVGQLLGEVSRDLSTLMRQELELAKAEVKAEAAKAGKGAGMLGGAGYAGHLTVLFLSLALWAALASAIPAGWAALIVAVVWAVVAGVLFVLGRKQLKTVNPKPERTVETLQRVPGAVTPSS